MTFYEELAGLMAKERDYLLTSPIIEDALHGRITLSQYAAFLKEAYFHVKQTVPLLMACGARLGDDKEWLRKAVAHYIADEYGHEQWILSDIAHCGFDAERVRDGEPSRATELMVSYAFDTIARRNPVGFFGMVYVLEGTSVALATQAAETIRSTREWSTLKSGSSPYFMSARTAVGEVKIPVVPSSSTATLQLASAAGKSSAPSKTTDVQPMSSGA